MKPVLPVYKRGKVVKQTQQDRERWTLTDRWVFLLPAHPQLCSNSLPVPFFILLAELLQCVNLFLTPPTFIDRRVEEVLPEAAKVLCIPCSFKLRVNRERRKKRRERNELMTKGKTFALHHKSNC